MNQPSQKSIRPEAQSAPVSPGMPKPRANPSNPFLVDDEFTLPYVPDDDQWHYCWLRHKIGNEDDQKNMVRHLNGKMPYEVVTLEMLPKEMQKGFSTLKVSQGQHTGAIAINDVVLGRCPMHLYRKLVEAQDIRTERMNDALRDEVSARNNGDRRGRLFVEEDSEFGPGAYRPGRAEFIQN